MDLPTDEFSLNFFLTFADITHIINSTSYFFIARGTKNNYLAKENAMHITYHADQRMNHRGITKEMIELTIQYGEVQDELTTLSRDAATRLVAELQRQVKIAKKLEETSLSRDAATRLVAELQRQMKIAKKVLDKGGLTLVTAFSDESVILEGTIILDETILITTYNCAHPKKSRKWRGKKNRFRSCNPIERAFRFHNKT